MTLKKGLQYIGDIKNYKHEQRIVIPEGRIYTDSLILKMYSMKKIRNKGDTSHLIKNAKDFLMKEIRNKKINSGIGFGFSILSEDMLNIAIWDKSHPIVLKNQIYGYKENFLDNIKLLDVRNIGNFCLWELGIVNFERSCWMNYLKSKQKSNDKKKYLELMIEGCL